MLSGISLICFGASYALVLILELLSLRVRFGWHRPVLLTLAVAGLLAHTIYLAHRAVAAQTYLWNNPADWCLMAAWALAVVYVVLAFARPQLAAGLFILPVVLGLVGISAWASGEPFAPHGTDRFWGGVHGTVLLLGTVCVCVGFLAGLMYLIQSYRLKHKMPLAEGFRLPSLEWLERVNSRALGLSTVLIAIGFGSGVVLSNLKHQGEPGYIPWSDPVVISLAAMLGWLLMAEVFRWVYPAARRGRKVAYLTLAAFVFLAFTLLSVTWLDTVHGADADRAGLAGEPGSVEAFP